MMPLCTTTMRPVQSRCGMRVLLGGPAVRGPARVADAVDPSTGSSRIAFSRLRQLAGGAAQRDPSGLTSATPAES